MALRQENMSAPVRLDAFYRVDKPHDCDADEGLSDRADAEERLGANSDGAVNVRLAVAAYVLLTSVKCRRFTYACSVPLLIANS